MGTGIQCISFNFGKKIKKKKKRKKTQKSLIQIPNTNYMSDGDQPLANSAIRFNRVDNYSLKVKEKPN